MTCISITPSSFFKDRQTLFYSGDRITCPCCLMPTIQESYTSRGGIKRIENVCPICQSRYPLIRPSGLPKYRRAL